MTATEAYDLAIDKGIREPACVQLGDRCIVGSWVRLSQLSGGAHEAQVVLPMTVDGKPVRGVRVLGEGATWEDACAAAGLHESVTRIRGKSLLNGART